MDDEQLRRTQLTFSKDEPMQVSEQTNPGIEATPEQEQKVAVACETVREYLRHIRDLVAGKYSSVREFVPAYLTHPGNVLVACCENGVVVRYEAQQPESKRYGSWMPGSASEVALSLSQGVVRCRESREDETESQLVGPRVRLVVANPDGTEKQEIVSFSVGFDVLMDFPEHTVEEMGRPLRVASVRNAMELQLIGQFMEPEDSDTEGQRFMTHTRFRLPVGWECIEVFPTLDPRTWAATNTAAWAEADIQASVISRQHEELMFNTLDPTAAARRTKAVLLNEFQQLLDSDPDREETLQRFLREHPELLCPTHVKMRPKLPFGDKISDFVFRDATSEYLLVELEKSTHSLFRKDGHTSDALDVARGQVTDWKRYIADNLRTVRDELQLHGISSDPQALVVIGRSGALSPTERRKLQQISNDNPKLRVWTYDDVYENAKSVIENFLGPLWDPGGETRVFYME